MTTRMKNLRSFIWTGGCILFGNALLAFTVEAFIIPHNVIMGGTTGLAIVLDRLTGIDTAAAVLVMNGALLLFGGIVLGRKRWPALCSTRPFSPWPSASRIWERSRTTPFWRPCSPGC